MTAQEIATKIGEHASHLSALLGQFESAMRTHREEAKEYPAVTLKLAAAQEKLAKLQGELQATEAAVAKAQAQKTKLLKELSAA